MGLGDHVNLQLKRGVKIITCDPSQRLIEAETRNGEVITVNVYSYTPVFRWPIPGEKWIVGEENGSWYLESIYEPQEASEAKEEVKEEFLRVTGYVENVAARNHPLGIFEVTKTNAARFLLVIFNITEAENFGEIEVDGDIIAITERSGSVGTNFKTTLTVVLPPGAKCVIKGNNSSRVSILHLWESVSS
jgi:hypothetical protein